MKSGVRVQEVADALDDHTRLAGAGARDDDERAFVVLDDSGVAHRSAGSPGARWQPAALRRCSRPPWPAHGDPDPLLGPDSLEPFRLEVVDPVIHLVS